MLSKKNAMKFGMLLASALMVAAASPAIAKGYDHRDVVRDERGAVVHDTDGDCVYTKWDSANNECNGVGAPDSFLVFFDFDRATLTPEAKSIIKQAAKAILKDKSPNVEVVGHADRSGSDKYNIGLSKRRANAVKDMLVKMGISGKKVAATGKGEREPLVPTKDGVREPQNRRVEILY